MIDVIFPTSTEAEHFNAPDGVRVHICGVGLTDCALFMGRYFATEERPDAVIMGGIAGVYEHSTFKIGETVIVSKEREADFGFFYPDGLRLLAHTQNTLDFPVKEWYDCPWAEDDWIELPKAASNSANCSMSSYIPTKDADIENMEGIPFFKACLKEGIPFFELRSISNKVDLNRGTWDFLGSITCLGKELENFIERLKDRLPLK